MGNQVTSPDAGSPCSLHPNGLGRGTGEFYR